MQTKPVKSRNAVRVTAASLDPCLKCARCCFGAENLDRDYYVSLDKDEAAALEKKYPGCTTGGMKKYPHLRFLKVKEVMGKRCCIFLSFNNENGDRPCTIYPDRPRRCRMFERGSNGCMGVCFGKNKRGIDRGVEVVEEG